MMAFWMAYLATFLAVFVVRATVGRLLGRAFSLSFAFTLVPPIVAGALVYLRNPLPAWMTFGLLLVLAAVTHWTTDRLLETTGRAGQRGPQAADDASFRLLDCFIETPS